MNIILLILLKNHSSFSKHSYQVEKAQHTRYINDGQTATKREKSHENISKQMPNSFHPRPTTYPILPQHIPSYPNTSHPIPTHPILSHISHPNPFYPIQSYLPTCTYLSHPISFHLILFILTYSILP